MRLHRYYEKLPIHASSPRVASGSCLWGASHQIGIPIRLTNVPSLNNRRISRFSGLPAAIWGTRVLSFGYAIIRTSITSDWFVVDRSEQRKSFFQRKYVHQGLPRRRVRERTGPIDHGVELIASVLVFVLTLELAVEFVSAVMDPDGWRRRWWFARVHLCELGLSTSPCELVTPPAIWPLVHFTIGCPHHGHPVPDGLAAILVMPCLSEFENFDLLIDQIAEPGMVVRESLGEEGDGELHESKTMNAVRDIRSVCVSV